MKDLVPVPIRVVTSRRDAELLCEELLATDSLVAADSEWHSFELKASRVNNGLSFCWTFCWRDKEGALQVVYFHNYGDSQGNIFCLKKWWTSEKHLKLGHNAIVDWHILANEGVVARSFDYDSLIMDFLLDENREGRHGLKECAKDFLGHERPGFGETFGEKKLKKDGTPYAAGGYDVGLLTDLDLTDASELKKLVQYASADAYDTFLLYEYYKEKLLLIPWVGSKSLWDYYVSTEVPTTSILQRMERVGMGVDVPFLTTQLEQAKKDQEESEAKILEVAGVPLNIGSGKQMAALLYGDPSNPVEFIRDEAADAPITALEQKFLVDKKKPSKKRKLKYLIHGLHLPVFDKTDGGDPSTSSPTIKKLLKWCEKQKVQNTNLPKSLQGEKKTGIDPRAIPLLKEYAAYNARSTQIGTFLENLVTKSFNGRIHGHINQTGTTSGRFSCCAYWTPITTRRGQIPICEVIVGDEVFTHKMRWRRVTAVLNQGIDQVYFIRFSNGRAFTCTKEHKLLLANGSWKAVREIVDVYFERLGSLKRESGTCSNCIQEPRTSYSSGGCKSVRYDSSQCQQNFIYSYVERGIQCAKSSSVFQVKDRCEESHENEVGRATSQLEGRVRRRLRIPNVYSWGRKAICAPCSAGNGARNEEATESFGRSSHRWEHEEQHFGQPCPSHACRTPQLALFTSGGLSSVTIKEAHFGGSLEVFDLTVEEDESYESAGVFSHNCSSPNLQNVSTGQKDTYHLRDSFVAPPGKTLIVFDYSQLEYRLLANATKDATLIKAFQEGWDLHSLTCVNLYPQVKLAVMEKFGSISVAALGWVAEEYPDLRKFSKILNFEIIYGVGPGKLAEQLEISKEEAQRMINEWFSGYPGVKLWQTRLLSQAKELGYGRTLSGRYRRPLQWRLNSKDRGTRGEEERTFTNSQIQGAAADLVKKAMILLDNSEELKELEVILLMQVHDELIFECPIPYYKQAMELIGEIMSHPYPKPLRVPTPASGGAAVSWALAKH